MATIVIELDTRGVETGVRRVQQQLENIRKTTNALGRDLDKVANNANRGFATLAAAAGRVQTALRGVQAAASTLGGQVNNAAASIARAFGTLGVGATRTRQALDGLGGAAANAGRQFVVSGQTASASLNNLSNQAARLQGTIANVGRGAATAGAQLNNAFRGTARSVSQAQGQVDGLTRSVTATGAAASAAGRQASVAFDGLSRSATAAQRAVARLQATAQSVGGALGNAGRQASGAFSGIGNAASAAGARLSGVFAGVDTSLKRVTGSVFGLQAALGALAVGGLLTSITNVATRFEAIERTLTAVKGATALAAEEFAFIRGEADRLGTNLAGTAKNYGLFLAAAKATNLTTQEQRDIFLSVSEAASVLGLSAVDVEGAMRAVNQILGKGTVQAEELKGQLGERLPGAFNIAARAMGVTTAELQKLLENGEVISDEFLPKFAAELRRTFGTDQTTRIETTQAALNRFLTTLQDAQRTFAIAGFTDGLVQSLGILTEKLNSPAIANGIRTLGELAGNTLVFLARNAEIAAVAIGAVVATPVLGAIISLSAGVAGLAANFAKLAVFLVGGPWRVLFVAVTAAAAAVIDLEAVIGRVRDAFATLAPNFSGLLTSVRDLGNAVGVVFRGITDEIAAVFGGLPTAAAGGLQGLVDLVRSGVDTVTQLIDRLGVALVGLGPTIERGLLVGGAAFIVLAREAQKAFDFVIDVAAQAITRVVDIFSTLSQSGLGQSLTGLVQAFRERMNEIVLETADRIDFVINIFRGLVAVVRLVAADILNAFTPNLGALGRLFTFVKDKALDAAATIRDSFLSIVDDAASATAGALAGTTYGDAFLNAFKGTVARDKVEQVLADINTETERLGTNSERSFEQAATSADTAKRAIADYGKSTDGAITSTEQLAAGARGLDTAFQSASSSISFSDQKLIDLNKKMVDAAKTAERLRGDTTEALEQISEGFLGTVTNAENFVGNLQILFSKVGVDLVGSFSNAFAAIQAATGIASEELGGALSGVGKIARELGFDIEKALGEDVTKVIRILGAATSDEFSKIFSVGGKLVTFFRGDFLGSIGQTFSSVTAAVTSFGSSAVAAFQALTASAASAAVALAPVALALVGITALVLGTAAIFGAFGDEVKKVATALAVVFAPFIFSVQLIIVLVESLISVFKSLGDAGSTVGRILTIVFAPVVLPILAITEAVRFLIDLFSNLGSVGGTVSNLLTAVLAPIVVPIRLIIEAVRFLIDLFGNLGGAVSSFGGIFSGVFNGILAVGRAVFAGIQAAGQVLFAVLRGIVSGIQGAFSAAFAVIRSVASAALSAVAGAGRVLAGVLSGVAGQITSVFSGAFSAVRSVATASFSAITGAGQALLGALRGVASAILGAFTSAFNAIRSVASSALNGIISAARSVAGTVGGIIGGISGQISGAIKSVGGLRGAIGSIGSIGSIGGGGIISTGKKIVSGAKKVLKKLSPFAEGGVITGPTSLAGAGLGGQRFARGTVLDSETLLGNANNVRATKSLGLAGEAGPEAILPLRRTRGGELGVVSQAPGGGDRTARMPSGGVSRTEIYIIRDARSEDIDRIDRGLTRLNASIESRSFASIERFFSP